MTCQLTGPGARCSGQSGRPLGRPAPGQLAPLGRRCVAARHSGRPGPPDTASDPDTGERTGVSEPAGDTRSGDIGS